MKPSPHECSPKRHCKEKHRIQAHKKKRKAQTPKTFQSQGVFKLVLKSHIVPSKSASPSFGARFLQMSCYFMIRWDPKSEWRGRIWSESGSIVALLRVYRERIIRRQIYSEMPFTSKRESTNSKLSEVQPLRRSCLLGYHLT